LIDAALKARAPVVPVAVLGAEEAVPVLARIPGLRRVMRIPRVPIAVPIPLPAKFRIRFLEPIDTAQVPNTARRDPELVAGLAEDIRALIQENLLELVAERRSAWL
jgi:1-acyl-sn-glycerol-3-phosphate acyltransferase